jgi:phosphatidate cytidylyltransferase
MTNLQKRILTSIIILPLSIFITLKGGNILASFLLIIFFLANYELFSGFKKKSSILFLDCVLIISLYCFYYMAEENNISLILLFWTMLLVILSDIGGYIFGKTFKWKKITKISPNKTLSGVFGSFIFSLISIPIAHYTFSTGKINFLEPKFFFLALFFSLVAQAGDLTISYYKRLEKIKDIGNVLPGHGGILDRIDGIIFVIILSLIFYKLNLIP